MENHKKLLFNAKKIAKWWPVLGSKQQVSIRNNWIKQAVVSNYYVENDFD